MGRVIEPRVAEGLSREHWCLMCGSDHGAGARCPGEIPATGPERHVWRVTAETEQGFEAYGVLLAPSGHRWRARVLTYPNVIWLVPGGRQSLKILARSAGEAERRARELIRQHCLARGQTLRDELAPLLTTGAPHRLGSPPPPPRPRSRHRRPRPEFAEERSGGVQKSPRFLRMLPVRFGEDMPREHATTRDLSEGGLFVDTTQPLQPERSIGLLLQLEHCTVPLRGSVVWKRDSPQHERPAGMGVRLVSPPDVYLSYVRALA